MRIPFPVEAVVFPRPILLSIHYIWVTRTGIIGCGLWLQTYKYYQSRESKSKSKNKSNRQSKKGEQREGKQGEREEGEGENRKEEILSASLG